MSQAPVPAQARLWRNAAAHSGGPPGAAAAGAAGGAAAGPHGYYSDVLRAHRALGLLRAVEAPAGAAAAAASASTSGGAGAGAAGAAGGGGDRAWVYASCAPLKDMELVVHGAARGGGGGGSGDGASGSGGGGGGLASPAFAAALHAALRAAVDGLGCTTFNVGILNIGRPELPLVARVVSRGRAASAASDYGCLEVFGGASIGHSDPFRVIEALDAQLAAGGGGGGGVAGDAHAPGLL